MTPELDRARTIRKLFAESQTLGRWKRRTVLALCVLTFLVILKALDSAEVLTLPVRHGKPEPVPICLAAAVFFGLLAILDMFTRRRSKIFRLVDLYLREQEDLASRDGLTKIYNRRFFEDCFREVDTHPVGMLMVDLDNFKTVNDTYGHQRGDEILIAAAQRIAGTLRSGDIVARFGGEEFVITLPATDLAGAEIVGENVRKAIEREPLAGVHVTASVGCSADEAPSLSDILAAADKALYSAKREGRNRTCSHEALH